MKAQIFDRTHLRRVRMNRRLLVRRLHAHIERGRVIAADRIGARDIDAGNDLCVINLEAGNEHKKVKSKSER